MTHENIATETLANLYKYKFDLMQERAYVRSKIHFSIAVGDHDTTHFLSKKLKNINDQYDIIENRINGIKQIDKILKQNITSQNLQTL